MGSVKYFILLAVFFILPVATVVSADHHNPMLNSQIPSLTTMPPPNRVKGLTIQPKRIKARRSSLRELSRPRIRAEEDTKRATVTQSARKPKAGQARPRPLKKLQDKNGNAAKPAQAQSEPDAKALQLKGADDGDVKSVAATMPAGRVSEFDRWKSVVFGAWAYQPSYKLSDENLVIPVWAQDLINKKKPKPWKVTALEKAAARQKALFSFGKGRGMVADDLERVLAFAGDEISVLFSLSRNMSAFLAGGLRAGSPQLLRCLGTIFYTDIRPGKSENKEGKHAQAPQQKALKLRPIDAIRAELCVHKLLQLAHKALKDEGGFDCYSPAARFYIKFLRKLGLDSVVTNFTYNHFAEYSSSNHPLVKSADARDARSQAFGVYLKLTGQITSISHIYDRSVGAWVLNLALNADAPDALRRVAGLTSERTFQDIFNHDEPLKTIDENLEQLIAKMRATGDDEFLVNFIMHTLSIVRPKLKADYWRSDTPYDVIHKKLEKVMLDIGHTVSPRFAQQFVSDFFNRKSPALAEAQAFLSKFSKQRHFSTWATLADWKATVNMYVRVIKSGAEGAAVKEFVTLFSRSSLPFVGRAVFLTEYKVASWTEKLKEQVVGTVLPAFKHDLSEVAPLPDSKRQLLSPADWLKFAETYMSFVKTIPQQNKDQIIALIALKDTFVKLVQKFHLPGDAQGKLIAQALID